MSNHALLSTNTRVGQRLSDYRLPNAKPARDFASDQSLAASITRAASKQTYYTIRFLADRDRVLNAYRAYAYFRWVDDTLDQSQSDRSDRIAFIARQQALIEDWYGEGRLHNLSPEEKMLLDLLATDQDERSGLYTYIQHMMAVMAFDANRRGYLISGQELDQYSLHLARGVTEALHYFIGHDDASPQTEARYLAVMGAHITHMLRDTFEDISTGYFNIPREYLESHGINPSNVNGDAYRAWVKSRVQQARDYFAAGKRYLAEVQNARCRLAGLAYTSRFERVLDDIELNGFHLRADYREHSLLSAALRMGWTTLSSFLRAS